MNFKKNNLKYLIIALTIIIVIGIILIIFPKFAKKEYYLTLNGDTDLVIKQNSIYEEAGYRATDNKGNDYQNEVVISGDVDTSVVGEYTITYSFNNIIKKRTISVVANVEQVTYLILSGSPTIFLKVGETYTEPGYTVIDNLESDLTSKVTIEGKVDTTKNGTYKLIYSVTNKSGKTIKEERTIIVMDSKINITYSPTNVTNDSVTINVSINDNYFDYILLPDNTKITTRNTAYKVTKNGDYNFTVYSKDGTHKQQKVTINNIDKEAPSGSCQATRKSGIYTISVNAKDNNKIKSYKYYFNDSLIKTDSKNVITYQGDNTNNIYVIISDQAENTKKITCNIEKTYDLEMHFINVGREDAILIRTNETTIFIDGGSYSNKTKLINYINSIGVTKFDALIGSHLHNNHIQAQGALIDNYQVSKVYYPQDLYTCNSKYCDSSDQKYILTAIKNKQIPQTIMKDGDHIEIGDILIDVYGPIELRTRSQTKYAQNYNSSNFILTYGNTKFMFTGDYMQSGNILKKYGTSLLDVDLLKYPHHGQETIGREITYAMSPEYVIVTNSDISSLKSRNEWQYFNDLKSQVYYSGGSNHILVKSDGENLSVIPNINPSDYKR